MYYSAFDLFLPFCLPSKAAANVMAFLFLNNFFQIILDLFSITAQNQYVLHRNKPIKKISKNRIPVFSGCKAIFFFGITTRKNMKFCQEILRKKKPQVTKFLKNKT
jgi:hypothetical protein